MKVTGKYREFQFGTLLVIMLSLTEILMAWFFVNDIGSKPIGLAGFILVSLILLISVLLFYGMTTAVDEKKITVWFGIGIIRKTIELSAVQQVDIVKSPWYYGWGIRLIPRGILYNVSGPDGVELKFMGSDKVVRIGTKDPVQLHAELTSRLRARDQGTEE